MNTDLSEVYARLTLSKQTIAFIESIRNSEPQRRVNGHRSNVTARYPSKKMGRTIQAESRTVELPFLLMCEHDSSIREYWDQAETLKLKYRNNNNKLIHTRHIPDYLVISDEGVYFVECKPVDELIKISQKSKARYNCENGRWTSPAGEEAAAEYGLGYRVFTSTDFTVELIRNIRCVKDFWHATLTKHDQTQVTQIVDYLSTHKSAYLIDLIKQTSIRATYLSIINRKIYFDLEHKLLCKPDHSKAYIDSCYEQLEPDENHTVNTSGIIVREGKSLIWDSKLWRVINVGKKVTLQNDSHKVIILDKTSLHNLIQSGDVKSEHGSADHECSSQGLSLLQYSQSDIETAIYKYKICRGDINEHPYSDKTVREWKRLASKSQDIHGTPLIGLISRKSRRGNRNKKISQEMLDALLHSIQVHYLQAKAPTKKSAYKLYVKCQIDAKSDYVSYQSYVSTINKLEKENVKKRREGKKSAYQHKQLTADHESELPRHGDRAFELAHVDHTELQITIVSAITGKELGRPWLSLMIDAYSRVVLAYWISFEPPSTRSFMMLIRRCVEKWNRLPDEIMFDRGKDFESEYVEVLLAIYSVTKLSRPPGESRFGTLIERYFRTLQDIHIHNCNGNTQHRRLQRSQSSSHDASIHAVWTPIEFDKRLAEYLYEIYPNEIHTGIADTPHNRFEQSNLYSDHNEFRYIEYDRDFILSTLLPAPGRGGKRKLTNHGRIKLKNFEYIPASHIYELPYSTNVHVKYDPYNVLKIYVHIHSEWHEFICTNQLVREYTESGIPILHEEVRERVRSANKQYRSPSQKSMDFMLSVEEQEKILRDKRSELLLLQDKTDDVQTSDRNFISRPRSPITLTTISGE